MNKIILFLLCFYGESILAITLQPHQKYPIDYMLSHPEQKGLLLNHSLGSGKTYLSLAFAEKFPTKNIVVYLPKFLKANWLIQMESYGIKNKRKITLDLLFKKIIL